MKKAWRIIPAVLLYMALSGTPARADTVVESGGYVTGINGISINGTTYNITFGTTDDTTFANTSTAIVVDAAEDIASDLTGVGSPAHVNDASGIAVGIDNESGPGTGVEGAEVLGFGWNAPAFTSVSAWEAEVTGEPGTVFWVEFSPVASPEPSTAALTLLGLGLLGSVAVRRKRKAPRQQQAA